MITWASVAQVFGFLALIASILSPYFKEYRRIVLFQLLSAALFCVHFGLLYYTGRSEALIACALNGFGLIRNIVLLVTEKKRTAKGTVALAVFFSAGVIAIGMLSWTSWISALFIIAMVLITVSVCIRDQNTLRLLLIISRPFALLYDILIGSIGGSINEAISLITALIAYLKNRKEKT